MSLRTFGFALCLFALPLAPLAQAPLAQADEVRLLVKESNYSVAETVERFEAAVKAKGLSVFPRIDHGAAAADRGLEMPPTVVVSFGNPKYGTPFMLENPQAGVDFPPKAVVYEDKDGKVFIAYNSAAYLYEVVFPRHGLTPGENDQAGFAKALEAFTDAATQ